MRKNVLEKYDPTNSSHNLSDIVEDLLKWSNPLYQDVVNGRAKPSELTESGMKEEYCLGRRLTHRFPEIFKSASYPSSYVFRATEKSRTIRSALSYAEGIFEKTDDDVKTLSLKIMDEDNDVFLRFYDIPCPDYDEKITNNKSFSDWIETFMDTSYYQNVRKDVQLQFPDDLLLGDKDILNFYLICIHELSILGSSRWCDLFSPDQLSVFQYYSDLKSYWIKGAGYPITGKRSVYLVQSVLDFFNNNNNKNKKIIALSFAHAETALPFLAFLNTFPVSDDLTPTNYQSQTNREFMTSRIAPYAANVLLVLYECGSEHYVRLLVNEKPVKIGLCSGSDATPDHSRDSMLMCELEVLRQSAYNATDGFAGLKKSCETM